jgi:hypothetical protein
MLDTEKFPTALRLAGPPAEDFGRRDDWSSRAIQRPEEPRPGVELRSAPEPLDPEQIFPCVGKTRAELFAPSGSNAHVAPSRRSLRPILAHSHSIT